MSRKILVFILIFLSVSLTAPCIQARNEIEVVFCIDMSGSTNGIIPDIKNKIWDVINGVNKLRPCPTLKIGLIGFSRPSFGKNDGYVKVLCDLTENYDQFFNELNILKPNIEKGDQFIGAALQMAYKMNWSTEPKGLRIIYLMGNGMVSSGGYDYRKTCEDILKRNIYINSIYCIQQKLVPRELAGWKSISDNTGGEFFTYKISYTTPLHRVSGDAQALINLNNNLNNTYLYYGISGKTKMNILLDADKTSLEMGESFFYSRIQYKASSHYQSKQAEWDLIGYIISSGTRFQNMDRSLMPNEIKNLDQPELEKYVLEKKDQRNIILSQLRTYISSVGQDTIRPDSSQLQGIILNSICKLSKNKGFSNGK